mmetsp:Transcript_13455/g.25683  ORF Transcript_13455/g.25683 Transcript_13455/m.25683 type:complete len:206 (-) Transcript_13455:551-1168(-)
MGAHVRLFLNASIGHGPGEERGHSWQRSPRRPPHHITTSPAVVPSRPGVVFEQKAFFPLLLSLNGLGHESQRRELVSIPTRDVCIGLEQQVDHIDSSMHGRREYRVSSLVVTRVWIGLSLEEVLDSSKVIRGEGPVASHAHDYGSPKVIRLPHIGLRGHQNSSYIDVAVDRSLEQRRTSAIALVAANRIGCIWISPVGQEDLHAC